MKTMTIGHAARRAEVSVETIRCYEQKGLIDQPLKPLHAGFRIYPDETVRRIQFIRQAQEIGYSLREISELLALKADPSTDCADIRARATTKLDEVDCKIARLKEIRAALTDLIEACPGQGALRACSIMDALVTGKTEAAR